MPLIKTEAIVLKDSSLSEADLIATLFTKEFGKIRAVARSARRLKSGFGGSLEPLSYIRIDFYERENKELAYLNHVDLEESFFELQADYEFQIVGAYLIEVVDLIFPEREANPKVFRLILSILRSRRQAVGVIQLLAYFNFWVLRLSGFLPSFETCSRCGVSLNVTGGRLVRSEHRIYCLNCSPQRGDRISPEIVSLAKSFSSHGIAQIHEQKQYRPEIFRELNSLLQSLLMKAVDKPVKSIQLFRDLKL